ncbi:MAG: hypothetical protein A3K03_09750 [Bdellovibrionales bacterium RIFOXYD1_FULL_44_7]|nr:MAG: hypothetical protein A3K03_09750 [Bdellovibrionales bacterium RIFOXYD1_FULL_44_7]
MVLGLGRFNLRQYNAQYYEIYTVRRNTDLNKIPSFRWIKRMLDLQPGERLLDAGSGDGNLLRFLSEGVDVEGVGVDSADPAISIAQSSYPTLKFIKADLRQLPFPAGHFDKVVCFNVIEHITEQETVMREFQRILKPGGKIILGTNIRDSICWWLYQKTIGEHTHVREFTAKEFVRFVSGFFELKSSAKTSGVFRFPRLFIWIFHYFLKGDILVLATRNYFHSVNSSSNSSARK